MREVFGILTRDCRFSASVLAEFKPLESLSSVASVSCNCLNSELPDDDDDDVFSRSSKTLITRRNCSAARSTLVNVVLTDRTTSSTHANKLVARSLRPSLKHTQHQHHQLLVHS